MDEIFAGDLFGLGLIGGDHAVAEHIHTDFLNVLWNHIGAAVHKGPGFGGECEADRGAGTGAKLDVLAELEFILGGIARSQNYVDDVVADFWVDEDFIYILAGISDGVERGHCVDV